MSIANAKESIRQTLESWEGVTSGPHRFGGLEFTLGKRELGHMHGNRHVDIPFPVKVRETLVKEGKAERHHILPDSGWISFYLKEEADIEKAIDLFKKSYDLALAQQARRSARQEHKLKGEHHDQH